MYTKGILRALLKEGNYTTRMVELSSSGSNIEYIELENEKTAFTAFLDERCLGNDTINKESTIKNAQWLIIREGYWDKLKKAHKDKSNKSFYQEVIKSSEIELALVYLKGEKVDVEIAQYLDKIVAGEIYLLLPFSNYPEKDRPYKSIRFVYLEAPRIDYAYIEEPSAQQADLPRTSNKKLHIYGAQAELHIRTHLIPDIRRRNTATLTASIYFINKKSERETVNSFDINIIARAIDYRKTITHSINIDLDWKNLDGGHQSQDQPRAYYVHLNYAQKQDENAESHIEDLQNFKNYISETPESKEPKVKNIEYDSKDLEKWHTLNAKTQQFDALPMQKAIEVRWDTWQTILDKFEEDKTNKIAYIGDVLYTQREYDPCGFSKIIIQDKADTSREAFTIFDEDVLTVGMRDKTETSFDIIAGDKRKEISITLDELDNKNVHCHGVMLAEGETHEEIDSIFQMDKVYSVLKGEQGHIRRHDQTHTKQLEHTGTPITDENCTDTDVVRDRNKRHSEPDIIQNFRLGTDYEFIGENELQLNLRYLYNKTVAEGTSIENNLLGKLWVFRYFWLDEAKAQTYFVPISSCRYPNQIARIKVYPDIKWEVAFIITIGTGYKGKITGKRENLSGYHKGFGFNYLKNDLTVDVTKTDNLGWKIEGKCIEGDGTVHSLGLENIRKTIDTAIYSFNTIEEYLDIFNPKAGKAPSAAVSKGVLKLNFNIDPPNIAFALGWHYGMASNNQVVPFFKGGIKLFPLIGITVGVDLVPIAKKIPYIGPILGWIIEAFKRLSRSDIYITFEVNYIVRAELSLSYNKVDGFDRKDEQLLQLEAGVSIKAGCKSNDTVFVAVTTKDNVTEMTEVEKWKVEGKVATSFSFYKEIGFDRQNDKQFEQSSVVWNGAKLTITCYELIPSKKISYKPSMTKIFPLFDKKTIYESAKKYLDEN